MGGCNFRAEKVPISKILNEGREGTKCLGEEHSGQKERSVQRSCTEEEQGSQCSAVDSGESERCWRDDGGNFT